MRRKKGRELPEEFRSKVKEERGASAHIDIKVFLRPTNPTCDQTRRIHDAAKSSGVYSLNLCLAALCNSKREFFFDGCLTSAGTRSNSQPAAPRETSGRRHDIAEAFAERGAAAWEAGVGPSELSNKGRCFPRRGGEMPCVCPQKWQRLGRLCFQEREERAPYLAGSASVPTKSSQAQGEGRLERRSTRVLKFRCGAGGNSAVRKAKKRGVDRVRDSRAREEEEVVNGFRIRRFYQWAELRNRASFR